MSKAVAISDETVINKIYHIRGKKIMLDRDLAEMYGVETKQLKRAVKRNIGSFPEDFMFEMNKEELQNWRSQFGTSNEDRMGLRYAPILFYRARRGNAFKCSEQQNRHRCEHTDHTHFHKDT
jgi:hypothetical protein